jgi:SAM-dependent methyltransferase
VLGHRYVGVDAAGAGADVLADLHQLPFRSASFDHVITNAVLEHVADPLLALREVVRVLRRGGVFSGSAAFLEPHHHHSYFHPTADGLVHLLREAGLSVEGLWPQDGWLVFDSLAEMPGPVSSPTRWLLRRLGAIERRVGARRLHPREIGTGRWLRRKSPAERHAELLTLAGQIDFLAVKPAE